VSVIGQGDAECRECDDNKCEKPDFSRAHENLLLSKAMIGKDVGRCVGAWH
jgi:hypothetical protein